MKNPLIRRIPREILGEWHKYLVIFVFLTLTIGFVAGLFVANDSMITSAENGVREYRQEDGNFELRDRAADELVEKIESGKQADGSKEEEVPVKLYENFFQERNEDYNCDGTRDGKIRVFQRQDQVDLPCLMEGRLPEKKNEIAIDRMHADNAGIGVGNEIRVGNQTMKVVGLIALVNYSTLFEKNGDTMFDAMTFDVALVTPECFEGLGGRMRYSYAWQYEDDSITEDDSVEKKKSDAFMKAVYAQAMLAGNEMVDFVPAYLNQAIHFALDDFVGDRAMGGYLLYILVAVLAFIFAITTGSTITKEASVIGTLRASGYSRGELLFHYMSAPVLVTILAAVVGNVLGYTCLKNVVVGMYYNSYSLPAYKTIWNGDAFVRTTLVPIALMLLINLFVIRRKLKLSPLRFLRHDLSTSGRKKAMRLPRFRFMGRFRLRILFQNIPNYAMLLIGISFAMIMMFFCVGIKASLKEYQDHAVDMMFAKHQYVLKNTVDAEGKAVVTSEPDAERYSIEGLQVENLGKKLEDVTVYGVSKDSKYIKTGAYTNDDGVYISSAYAQKLGAEKGDKIRLKAKYTKEHYDFSVEGVFDYPGSVSVFMDNDRFNEVFDREKDSFNGYLSDHEITDIKEENIISSIGEEEITKVSRQLDHSIGAYMSYFQVVCVILAAILIYLLTKVVIEKNENAISMVKILGYDDREIGSLYLVSTTWVVVVSELAGMLISWLLIKAIWMLYLQTMGGWIAFRVPMSGFIRIFVEIFAAYLLILAVDYARIRRIPMDQALKNVE